MSFGVTPEQLLQAMKGEAGARKHYQRLMSLAPDDREADIIERFFEDEGKHFSKFRMLYEIITGNEPETPKVSKSEFDNYLEGVDQAILDELEAYEFYRDIYLSTKNPMVRDIFFEALTDENEHAANLNRLYIRKYL
ncbi:MAG: ferritin family protein [Caulobacteraceae bacterium]